MAVNVPRVLGLREEIISVLEKIRDDVLKNNPELAGVFDRLIIFIEVQKMELQKERYSFQKLSLLIKFIDLIDIIYKWTNTLCYKIGCYFATLTTYKMEKKWQLGKILSSSGLMQI